MDECNKSNKWSFRTNTPDSFFVSYSGATVRISIQERNPKFQRHGQRSHSSSESSGPEELADDATTNTPPSDGPDTPTVPPDEDVAATATSQTVILMALLIEKMVA